MRDIVIDAILVIMMAIIFATQVSRITDHNAHIEELNKFMNKGGRNTSAMGISLCKRVNSLEANQGLEPVNCDEIYK